MIFPLYIITILLISYHYRYDLFYYILSIIYDLKHIYIHFLNSLYKYRGCPIYDIKIYGKSCCIKYGFSNKTYIIFLKNNYINSYQFINRFFPDYPYNISNIKNELGINTDEDILFAYVNIDNTKVDITDFCKMISGPKGNFYNDLIDVIKPTLDTYKYALIDYIKTNCADNIDIDLNELDFDKYDLIIKYIRFPNFDTEYIV
jgi:hypothetical protein